MRNKLAAPLALVAAMSSNVDAAKLLKPIPETTIQQVNWHDRIMSTTGRQIVPNATESRTRGIIKFEAYPGETIILEGTCAGLKPENPKDVREPDDIEFRDTLKGREILSKRIPHDNITIAVDDRSGEYRAAVKLPDTPVIPDQTIVINCEKEGYTPENMVAGVYYVTRPGTPVGTPGYLPVRTESTEPREIVLDRSEEPIKKAKKTPRCKEEDPCGETPDLDYKPLGAEITAGPAWNIPNQTPGFGVGTRLNIGLGKSYLELSVGGSFERRPTNYVDSSGPQLKQVDRNAFDAGAQFRYTPGNEYVRGLFGVGTAVQINQSADTGPNTFVDTQTRMVAQFIAGLRAQFSKHVGAQIDATFNVGADPNETSSVRLEAGLYF